MVQPAGCRSLQRSALFDGGIHDPAAPASHPKFPRERGLHSGASFRSTTPGRTADAVKKDDKSTKDGIDRHTLGRKGRWRPYSEEGRQDLQDALKGLENLTSRGRQHQPKTLDRSPRNKLPQSPVLRKKTSSFRLEPPKKREATEEDKSRLRDNAWASMLSDSHRICQATGVRTPKGLMLDLKLVKNPDDGGTYLMPADLANLVDLKRGQRKAWLDEEVGYQSKSKDVMEGHRATHQVTGTASAQNIRGNASCEEEPILEASPEPSLESAAGTNKSDYRPRHPVLRIVPYYNLFRSLTSEFVRQGPEDTKPRTASDTLLARLVPLEWKESFAAAKFYDENRRTFEAAGGNSGVQPNPEAGIHLNQLKWQQDIQDRLVKIMWSRVLAALEGCMKMHPDGTVGEGSLCMTLAPPQNGFVIKDEGLVPASPEEMMASSSAKSPNHVEELKSNYTWVRGSIFLTVAPLESFPLPTRPGSETNHLIPPLVSITSANDPQFYTRIPVFSLSHLFGDADIPRLNELVDSYLPYSALRSTETKAEESVLTLFKSKAHGQDDLVKEIWQLWRYIGGWNNVAATGKVIRPDYTSHDGVETGLAGPEEPKASRRSF